MSSYTALPSNAEEPAIVEATISEKPTPNLYQITIPDNVRSGDVIYVEIEESRKYDVSSNASAIGATIAGFFLGTLCFGPVVGLATAGVALYGTTRTDKVGEAVRGVGTGTCICYNKTIETANKYQLSDKIQSAVTVTAQKAKDIDQEYKIGERLSNFTKSLVTKAKPIPTQVVEQVER